MKPTYCTQNEGNCQTCSLSNYGRDCKNNPIVTNHPWVLFAKLMPSGAADRKPGDWVYGIFEGENKE